MALIWGNFQQMTKHRNTHIDKADHSILAVAPNQWSSAAISQCVHIGMGLESNNIDFVQLERVIRSLTIQGHKKKDSAVGMLVC